MRVPDILRLFMSPFGPPPPFKFNRRLYADLVRELEDGDKIEAPDAEPEVEFAMGPIDGCLGSFDPSTLKITADVLEIFLMACAGRHVTPEDLKRKFDEDLTGVLAHEGGHWNLHKKVGWRAYWDKFSMLGVLTLAGVGILGLLGNYFWRGVVGSFVPGVYAALGPVFGVIAAAAIVILAAIIHLNLFRIFFGIWQAMSFAFTYQVCWTERYARRYAEDSKRDSRWKDVIETRNVVGT